MITKIGNWVFHYRNFLFPVFYAALFIPSPGLFENMKLALISGSIIIFTGIMIRCITIGLVYIIRGGAKRQIHAESLVTGGIYSVCRNPMYLGNILLIIGFGILANSLLFTLIFSPLFLFLYYSIISAEEDFLLRKFGNEFVNYKNSTNAILPKLGNIRTAFTHQTFNFKKVIYKEYNSLFLYFSGIILILYFYYNIELQFIIIYELIIFLIYCMIKFFKYAGKRQATN
jgi:protein-S-isoprenylcysteine O-methyltransferase Ste14